MLQLLKPYSILFLCLLGSLVRLLYGYWFAPWTTASDQIAWEILLEQRGLSYDLLIHYPHEGGTILVSLLARIAEWFTDFSSLTTVAFLVDFAFRWVQISIVKRVFNLEMALLFGLWTIFATPVMLPWGTVNFGLHALSAVFPFVLLYLLTHERKDRNFQLLIGLFLGLAVWFSYSNLILVPLFFLFRFLEKAPLGELKHVVGSLSAVLLTHFLVRIGLDAGFHLSGFELISIRGAEFSMEGIGIWERLGDVFAALANSAAVLPDSEADIYWYRYLYYAFLAAGTLGVVLGIRQGRFPQSTFVVPAAILLFLGIYGFSPFFFNGVPGNYVGYRHLTYVLPLVALLVLLGLSYFRFKSTWIAIFLVFGLSRSALLFTVEPAPANDMYTQAAGWVLGTKLGHAPERLTEVLERESERKALLVKGVGWGMGTALFKDEPDANTAAVDEKIELLIGLTDRFPADYKAQLYEGLKFSFGEFVTPQLNSAILERYTQEVIARYSPPAPQE